MTIERISDNRWQSRWLEFVRGDLPGAGTQIWEIVAKQGGTRLGTVKWFGRWRQYAFFPQPDTIFNADCLADIWQFVNARMLERAEARL